MKILLLSLLLSVTSALASPQEVKFVIPFTAGGSADKIARLLCNELSNSEFVFQPEFKLGSGGTVAANHVANTKSGTTLMISSQNLVAAPITESTVKYDLLKDFVLVDYLATEPLMVLVNAKSNIVDFKNFVKRSQTEFMPYGSGGNLTSAHIVGAIISNNNKNLVHVPYKGASAALVDLLAGNITWQVDSDLNVKSFIADGRVKPLAIVANRRMPQYPDVPTLQELGVNDRGVYRWHVLVANSEADTDILKYVRSRLNEASIRAKIDALGLDSQRPKNLDKFLQRESDKMSQVLKDYNIK